MKLRLLLPFLLFLALSCSKGDKEGEKKPTNAKYALATQHRDHGVADSAFYYFNLARDEYLRNRDSIGAGTCLINMAIISTNSGDLFGGQELSVDAIRYFDEENPEHYPYFVSIYNNLGIASFSLKEYPKAVDFYHQGLRFVTDSAYSLIVKNNIANAWRKVGQFEKAISLYESVLRKEKEPVNQARVASNLTYARWLASATYNPVPALLDVLKRRRELNDLWGQNSSYAQLADYYKENNADSALFYSTKMYEVAKALKSPDDQMEALQKLIPLSGSADSRRYFQRYRVLEDSTARARANARNQFALIRFETERHKASNLELQQTNTVRIIQIAALALVLIAVVLLARRRERHLARKAADTLRDNQLATSKKVHDVVANGLYRLITETENRAELNRDSLLDDLEILYEKSRNISYDESGREPAENYSANIGRLLTSFATPETRVIVVGNDDEWWNGLSKQAKSELKFVMQELMVNMSKHSGAQLVVIRFTRQGSDLVIGYQDDGRGLPPGNQFGNGLRNTETRIQNIGGSISFENSETGGFGVRIELAIDD